MEELISNTVTLSRIQFALTAIFHMLWPVLTTGMAIYLVVIEGLWLKTRNLEYYHHARFWSKLYVLNFGIGVASGLPMAFQFGLNWAPFSESVGDFFGTVLGFEGTMAFMLEASFLGIMLFGWDRVPPIIHWISTILVAFGANLSTFWILSANSWLQTPAGGEFIAGKFVVQDYFQAIANPFMVNSFLHMFFATLETSLFVIGGISAWYIINQHRTEFFLRSFKVILAIAIVIAPLQVFIGHLSAEQVYHYQPAKLAAMEAQWETVPAGEPADWSLLALPNNKSEKNEWEIKVPGALSYLLELKSKLDQPVKGLKEWEPKNRLEPLQHFLPQVWFFILGLFLFLYILLDGFDLGVGILSLTASSEERRSILMTSLGNVWDANETWLILMGGSLFGAFPLAYATILNALYLPAVVMVVGLILRAVSFEFVRTQLFTAPLIYIFGSIPVLGILFIGLLLRSLYQRQENTPLVYTFLVFCLSFIGLGFVIFPNIIPPSVTIYQAAAAPSSLVFMLIFIGFLIPVVLFYNVYNYVVFRGKIINQE